MSMASPLVSFLVESNSYWNPFNYDFFPFQLILSARSGEKQFCDARPKKD